MGLLAVCYSEACRHSCPAPHRQARADCSLPMEQPREDGMPGVPGTRSADNSAPGAQGRFSHLNHGDFKNNLLFVYFWLHWVFVAVRGLSLVVASGSYSLVATLWLLVAITSLVAEPRL